MKVNKFIGLVVAGIVAVSSLACGGEDNEDGEEDRIVVYNTSKGEYLYDKKFKFFGKWETAKENKEKERFVPDVISQIEGYTIVDDRYFDNECSESEKIPMGTYSFYETDVIEGFLEKLKWYDFVNIDNKNRNIVKFPVSRDNKYCYFTWEEEKIDYYVKNFDGDCVSKNDMAEVNSGISNYQFMLVVDSNDIECFSYDDLIERKKSY